MCVTRVRIAKVTRSVSESARARTVLKEGCGIDCKNCIARIRAFCGSFVLYANEYTRGNVQMKWDLETSGNRGGF